MDMIRLHRTTVCLAILGITVLSPFFLQVAVGRPPYKHALKKLYGARLNANLHQCATCHLTKDEVPNGEEFDEENPPHNVFGERLKLLGEQIAEGLPSGDIVSRLKQIAGEDSDEDGVRNEVEILAGKYPGRKQSVPNDQELLAADAAMVARQREATGYAWEPFQRVNRPDVPQTAFGTWERNPIDAFVASEYTRLRLTPTTDAPKHTLLRRVYLDLIGVPPTREQLNEFLIDENPLAYERIVEQLLSSPLHGQRWGRHWMDIWRYSDWAGWTGGGQIRDSQPHVWRWRDWIIDSLNADKPYDDMVRSMLAADELSPTDESELRATGYLVRNYKMLSRETWMQDTVEHTCKAFLAITMNCARCHDHMYDPISQMEYYQFRAIFEPYNVRADRIAKEPDVKIDGVARAFDADPNAVTYLFVKGDDRNPDKNKSISVGVPSILGNNLAVWPVRLPVSAYYPGTVPFIRTQLLDASEKALRQANQDLAKSESDASNAATLVANENATDQQRFESEIAKQRVDVSRLAVMAAEADLKSLKARIAADDLKFSKADNGISSESSVSTTVSSLTEVSTTAANLEQQAKLISVELDARRSELALNEAENKLKAKADDAALKKKAADAKQKRDETAKTFEEAKKKAAEPAKDYSPLTSVFPQQSTGRRAAFAHWLISRENPLAARVAVNHIWNRHFGRGLVPSVFDFGQNGKSPTHPGLLDWLSAELMEPSSTMVEPWSMKHIHRLIVTSSVYRLSTQTIPEMLSKDPDNEYLARASTKRMEAELVRDSVLFVAGNLDVTMEGPDIDYEKGFEVPRRSLYFRHAAEKEMTFLKIFDAAAVTECYQRKSSVMPQQALAMINSELTITQARRLVRYWKGAAIEDDSEYARVLFEHILSRRPTEQEVLTCVQFLKENATRKSTVECAAKSADLTKPSPDSVTRAREQLAHVLMNHHEFVSIY
jgi:Protein of unknown function (DUF1553)/Protein of unknown function (DUF1549)